MIKGVLLVALLASVAQVFPSCGGGTTGATVVVGWVEAKLVDHDAGAWLIVVNAQEYIVPSTFWREVQVGDLVKWDGTVWTIVRKAGT